MPTRLILTQGLPAVAVALAVAVLGWTLAQHFGRNSPPGQMGPANRTIIGSPLTEPGSVGEEISPLMWREISDWHLFGEVQMVKAIEQPVAEEVIEEPEVDLSNIPETRIPLKLSGIAYSSNDDNAFAMIITPDGHQAEYQIGEQIGAEASVHLIEQKRVVIERDGKFEALSLPESSTASRNTNRTVRARAPKPTRRALPNQQRIPINDDEDDPEA
ncbi:MAG: type II secretion system protein N [Pseudomonadota bacterium]